MKFTIVSILMAGLGIAATVSEAKTGVSDAHVVEMSFHYRAKLVNAKSYKLLKELNLDLEIKDAKKIPPNEELRNRALGLCRDYFRAGNTDPVHLSALEYSKKTDIVTDRAALQTSFRGTVLDQNEYGLIGANSIDECQNLKSIPDFHTILVRMQSERAEAVKPEHRGWRTSSVDSRHSRYDICYPHEYAQTNGPEYTKSLKVLFSSDSAELADVSVSTQDGYWLCYRLKPKSGRLSDAHPILDRLADIMYFAVSSK